MYEEDVTVGGGIGGVLLPGSVTACVVPNFSMVTEGQGPETKKLAILTL